MRRRVWAVILWCLALLWMALCFYLSWQTGEETAGFSMWLAGVLMRLLAVVNIRPEMAAFHMALRRMAHLIVFFVAGGLFGSAFAVTFGDRLKWALRTFTGSMIVCVLCAMASEIFKQWIPGRHLQWDELALNLCGALLGVLLACAAGFLVRRIRKKA